MMKTKSKVIVSLLVFACFLLTASKGIQEKFTIEGVYDGKEDYGYSFIVKDKEGEERTMAFQNIDEALLTSYNLDSNEYVGSKFSVTYTTKIIVEKDSDGFDDETEINTIIALKKL